MSYSCKYNLPHDLFSIYENQTKKIEICKICGRKYRFNKGVRGRVKNTEYLKLHLRNFCQRWGATKRIYYKIYRPQETVIYI